MHKFLVQMGQAIFNVGYIDPLESAWGVSGSICSLIALVPRMKLGVPYSRTKIEWLSLRHKLRYSKLSLFGIRIVARPCRRQFDRVNEKNWAGPVMSIRSTDMIVGTWFLVCVIQSNWSEGAMDVLGPEHVVSFPLSTNKNKGTRLWKLHAFYLEPRCWRGRFMIGWWEVKVGATDWSQQPVQIIAVGSVKDPDI